MNEHIIKQHSIIEALFASYSDAFGSDMEKYKNHVYRIFNYSLFLSNAEEAEKYAIAAFFHDIGIWTNKTFDYLKPSIVLAKNYLIQHQKENWTEEISLMIDNHHKTTVFTGNYSTSVEIFRNADWTDVSLGFIHFQIPSAFIKEVEKQFSYKGFHLFLVKLFLKNLLKHPLKPLPMFKK